MTNEEERIVVAEFLGISFEGIIGFLGYGYKDGMAVAVGDYPNDMEAIRKAILAFNPCRCSKGGTYPKESELWDKFYHNMLRIGERNGTPVFMNPASEYCEAFIKTIGKWKE